MTDCLAASGIRCDNCSLPNDVLFLIEDELICMDCIHYRIRLENNSTPAERNSKIWNGTFPASLESADKFSSSGHPVDFISFDNLYPSRR